MRVRIKTPPLERQIDGIQLDHLLPGTVRDVSTSLGTWLVAQGYAELEMRSAAPQSADSFDLHVSDLNVVANDRRKPQR